MQSFEEGLQKLEDPQIVVSRKGKSKEKKIKGAKKRHSSGLQEKPSRENQTKWTLKGTQVGNIWEMKSKHT